MAHDLPLADVKILDFTWVMAGPAATRVLAEYGANVNAGKLCITLDLSQEAGRAVALDLVRWADVVAESFSPKAMRAWGLDYAALRQVQPAIIKRRQSERRGSDDCCDL